MGQAATLHERLAHQSRGRALSAEERALAAALEAIFAERIHNFAAVAAELSKRGIVAPNAATTSWDQDLLARELSAINASLDEAYARDGIGA